MKKEFLRKKGKRIYKSVFQGKNGVTFYPEKVKITQIFHST